MTREISFWSVILVELLGLLTVNSLYANWNFNGVWDLFFARIEAPIFNGAHATSVLSVCFMAVALSIKRYKSPKIPIVALFGTASLHEFALLLVGWFFNLITRTPMTQNGISLSYAAWLIGFVLIGFKVLGSFELRMWVLIFGVCCAWYLVAMLSPWPSTLEPAYFYNLGSNVSESVSWFLPVNLWIMPKQWLERKNQNYIVEVSLNKR